jgi:hypothetical protein
LFSNPDISCLQINENIDAKIIIQDLTDSILLWKGRYKNAFVPLSQPIMQPFEITIASNNNFLRSLKFRQVGLQKQMGGKSNSVGGKKKQCHVFVQEMCIVIGS